MDFYFFKGTIDRYIKESLRTKEEAALELAKEFLDFVNNSTSNPEKYLTQMGIALLSRFNEIKCVRCNLITYSILQDDHNSMCDCHTTLQVKKVCIQ